MSTVNLLPDESINRHLRHAKGIRWLAGGLGVVLLVVVYSLFIRRNLITVQQQLEPLERQLAEKQQLIEKIGELETELERAVEKQNTVQELLDEPAWPHIMSELASDASDNAWFDSMRFAKTKVRRHDKELIEVQFSLQGHALSNFELASFIARLRNSPYFDDVEFEYSQMKELEKGTPVIEFEIQGTLS